MSSRQPCASELRAVCRFRFQFGLAVRQHVCQIDGKLSPTSCAMLLVRVRVRVCDRVPTQGSRVCLGAGQAVPNPASSRRWPSVRDPSRGASASVWPTLRLARRSPGCGASHVRALAPPRWDVARGGCPAVARCALGPGSSRSVRSCGSNLGRPSLCLSVAAAREPDFSLIFRQPTRRTCRSALGSPARSLKLAFSYWQPSGQTSP